MRKKPRINVTSVQWKLSITSRTLISSSFTRIRWNAIRLKFRLLKEIKDLTGEGGGVADTIPMAFSLFTVGQTESFVPTSVRARVLLIRRRSYPPRGSRDCGANRGKDQDIAHIFPRRADSGRSFLPPCLFIAGFNVTRVISDYIFGGNPSGRRAIILMLGSMIDRIVANKNSS